MSARRDWYSVQCRLFRLPKFRGLSDDAQLALFYVWALAGDETPEATWRTGDHLELALQVHGRNPATIGHTLAELRAGGWLDTLEDGTLVVHDWDDHQYAASREIAKAWEAARLRTWRKKRKADAPEAATSSSTQGSTAASSSSSTSSSTQESVPVRTTYDGERTAGKSNGADLRTTCPTCGDLLDDHDPNVVVADHGRQLWHRTCPDGAPLPRLSPVEWSA